VSKKQNAPIAGRALLTVTVTYAVGAGTYFAVEPSERTTSISTSSGEGSAGGVTWVNPLVVQIVPSGITTVIEVGMMMNAN